MVFTAGGGKQNHWRHLFKWPAPGEDQAGGAMLGHRKVCGAFGPHRDEVNQSTASTVFTPAFYLFV